MDDKLLDDLATQEKIKREERLASKKDYEKRAEKVLLASCSGKIPSPKYDLLSYVTNGAKCPLCGEKLHHELCEERNRTILCGYQGFSYWTCKCGYEYAERYY